EGGGVREGEIGGGTDEPHGPRASLWSTYTPGPALPGTGDEREAPVPDAWGIIDRTESFRGPGAQPTRSLDSRSVFSRGEGSASKGDANAALTYSTPGPGS